MSYREDERKKTIEIRDEMFRDPGGGLYSKIARELVLQDPTLNLWAGEYQCDEYIHLHVIPENNTELRDRVTSPNLCSRVGNMSDAWKSVLKDRLRYIVMTPEEFLRPALGCPDTHSIAGYLEKRYWM